MFPNIRNIGRIVTITIILIGSIYLWSNFDNEEYEAFSNMDNSPVKQRVVNNDLKVDKVTKCKKRDLHLANELPATGLISFPGSGNTWIRHMLQQMTGMCMIVFHIRLFIWHRFADKFLSTWVISEITSFLFCLHKVIL